MTKRAGSFFSFSLRASALAGGLVLASCGGSHGHAGPEDAAVALPEAGSDAEAGAAVMTAAVSVEATTALATVGPFAFGLHASVYDNSLHDPGVPGLLQSAGVTLLRWPGGGYSDNYHWSMHTITPWFGNPTTAGYEAPGTDFGGFVSVLESAGVSAMITVNYGSNAAGDGPGEPDEAAAWVAYANGDPANAAVIGVDSTGKDWGTVGDWAALRASTPLPIDDGRNFLRIAHPAPLGIRYWEVGNEVFGNGYYTGAAPLGGDGGAVSVGYEEDLHVPYDGTARSANPVLSGTRYGAGVTAYVAAMKAVDPAIRVGAVLNTPPADYRWGPTWDMDVLQAAGPVIDFVIVHWYTSRNAAALLRAPRTTLPTTKADLQGLIAMYCGANAPNVEMTMTELGPSFTVPAAQGQAEGLFAADTYLTALESGFANVDWLELHNGTFLAETTEDKGPAFYGIQIAHQLASPGDTLVTASSDQGLIVAHAARRADGTLGVMLINTQPATPTDVTVTVAGMTLAADAARYDYAPSSGTAGGTVTGPTAVAGANQFTVTVPAYTASVFALSPSP